MFGKTHNYVIHPVSQKQFECSSDWRYGPLSSFQGISSSEASSFHASLLQAIDCVIFLALCLQVVSQAPQHFGSSETEATCDGCMLCPPVYLLGHFLSFRICLGILYRCNQVHLHNAFVLYVLCVSLCRCSYACVRRSIFYVCVTCCDLDVTISQKDRRREGITTTARM